MNAISDIDGAELYSVDYLEQSYRHPDKPSGFLVAENFPQLMDKWHVFRGGDVSRFIENIGGNIDLLVLDTVHSHPWETLNFLCVLPFLKHNSWTVLHDITLFAYSKNVASGLACRYLFNHIVSDEKISPVSDHGALPANIGAFKVSDDAHKYINSLFESLFIPWEIEVQHEDIENICAVIKKYYSPEQYKSFCGAVDLQRHITERKRTRKIGLYNSLKIFVKSWQPNCSIG